jgi:hypothetical protein
MRKLMAIPMAGIMALTLAASALAGPNVGNFSGTVTLAQASWDSYDSDTKGSGYVVVGKEQGGDSFAEYGEFSAKWVQCTGADTPDDPDDDTFGTVGSNVWGYGPATLAIGKNFGSATASGTLEASRETFDECTGEYSYESLPALAFSLDLSATSGTVKESSRGSFKLPGEYNSHSSYKSIYRFAEGTIDLGAGAQEVYGQIGTVSWRDHSNG